jgi:ABC-type branched-subunit amino acid transport system ATPase component
MSILAAHGLTVKFGGLTALDSLDLQLRAGEILGLIGPNGSGKTTLFNALTVVPPAGGRVLVDGKDITGASPQAVSAAGVARTFQRSRLCLPLSVFDNLMIGNHRNLDHGIWTNLFRRGALERQIEARSQGADALAFSAPACRATVRSCRRAAHDRSQAHRDLQGVDRRAAHPASRRAVSGHDPRRNPRTYGRPAGCA